MINPGKSNVKPLRRLPKASCSLAADKLSSILDGVVSSNSPETWKHLFLFGRRCMRCPKRRGRSRYSSLTTGVNSAIRDESEDPDTITGSSPANRRSDAFLADRVSRKLVEGDFKGAVRLAGSNESFAEPCDRSLQVLREKHPAPHPKATLPQFVVPEYVVSVLPSITVKAIYSFPGGSAGGSHGLLPQHL